MTLFLWSQTAATNNTVDSTINWREGQAPSTVNNSTRAMMAAIAKYRDDIGGALATGGTSTSYTLISNQGFTSLIDGMTVTVIMHVTNGAAAQLNVDSLGSKPITVFASTAAPAGALSIGSVHRFSYDTATSSWIAVNYFSDSFNATSAPDLNAIEALSTTGILRRTGTNTWDLAASVTDLAATTANRLYGTNGSGVSGLATVTTPITYSASTLAVSAASTSASGVVQLADAAAQEASTSGRAVTSDVQIHHPSAIKAFVKWDSTSGPTNNQSLGVSSLADGGSARVDITFSTAFSAASYAIAGTSRRGSSAGQGCEVDNSTPVTTTFVRLNTTIYSGGFGSTAYGSGIFIGDQ